MIQLDNLDNPRPCQTKPRTGLWVFAWLALLFSSTTGSSYLAARAVNEAWTQRLVDASRPKPQIQQDSIGGTKPPTDAYSIWSQIAPNKNAELIRMLPHGEVMFHKELTTDTASRTFWSHVANSNPLAPKLEVSERQQQVLLQEIRELRARLAAPVKTAAKER